MSKDSVAFNLLLVAIFGVLLPWSKGRAFLDPLMLTAYGCLGALFASWEAIRRFGLERPKSLGDTLKTIGIAIGSGIGLVVVFLAVGLVAVNVVRGGSFVWPFLDVLGESLILGATAGAALGLMGAWFTLKQSAMGAQRAVRIVLVLGVVGFYLRPTWLPDNVMLAAAVSLAVALVFGLLVWRETV